MRQHGPVHVHSPGGFPDGEPPVVPGGQGSPGLKGCCGVGGQCVGLLQDDVGLGEPGWHVAAFQRQRLGDGQIAVGVYCRRVGFQGGYRIGHEGQRAVLDPHHGGSPSGCFQVVGGHRGDLVAHETHAGVQHQHIRRQPRSRDVCRRNGCPDARHRQRGPCVDRQHVSVGIWTTHDDAVKQTRERNVCRIYRATVQLVGQLSAGDAAAHGIEGRCGWIRHLRRW